ncbi:MAG: hypothetical protein N3A69_04175 [Leptospiraceae bacterium]|nr:hypothetical protein [Leptospiraceae bacterium]
MFFVSDISERLDIPLSSVYRLHKIWLYVMRDLYSGAYITMLDLSDGENTESYLKLLEYWIYPKRDKRIPLCGVPKIIMSDRGAGLSSIAFQDYLQKLGIEHRTHTPQNPSAKGFVEAQIGAVQRNVFKLIRRKDIHDFNELQRAIDEHVIYDNHIKKYYQKYYESLKKHPPVIAKVNLSEVIFTVKVRKLTKYGTVLVDKVHYFVVGQKANDLQEGEELKICKQLDGTIYALDVYGNRYELRQGIVERNASTFKILNHIGEVIKSKEQKLREEILKTSQDFVNSLNKENFSPPNVLYPEYESQAKTNNPHFQAKNTKRKNICSIA